MGAVAWSPFVADDGEQRAKKSVFALLLLLTLTLYTQLSKLKHGPVITVATATEGLACLARSLSAS